MRILCILLVCFVAVGYALPPRYYAVPEQIDDDDDADVQDSPYFSAEDDDMYTFPAGGPGGPPSNRFISSVGSPMIGGRQARTENDVSYLGKYYFDYDSNVLYQKDEGTGPLSPAVARQLLRMGEKKGVEEKQEEDEDDDVVEDEEDQEDEEDEEEDADDEPDYAVPDMNKLFPQIEGKPTGPRTPPQLQATRRYRYIAPTVNTLSDLDDTVIVEAVPRRIMYDESSVEEDEDAEDDADADDEPDYNVPSFDTLFPAPGQKQGPTTNLFNGVANTWNSARPPGRYGRLVRLFQSPLHHDVYNPDYVIDPVIALNRRNERMKNRYSSPHWRRQNILTPYNYKPILYQKGHWGNPREHDYNPVSGHHYLGGIYNGKTYVPQY